MNMLLSLLAVCGLSAQMQVATEFGVHRHVILTDPLTIRSFLSEFILDEDLNLDEVTKVTLVDTMGDGFTVKDVFSVEPQGYQHVIQYVSTRLQEQMSGWSKLEEEQIRGIPPGLEDLDRIVDDDESCLIVRLASAIKQSYDGDSLGALIVTGPNIGYKVQLWNFDPVHFIPPEGGCLDAFQGGGGRRDLLVTQSTDTVWVPDTVMVDLLYVVQTQTDSIFTSRGGGRSLLFEETE